MILVNTLLWVLSTLPAMSQVQPSYQAEGALNLPFRYLDNISHSFDQVLSENNPFSIYNDIYPDKNPRSGKFYYLPASYSLSFDPKTQKYDIEIIYGADGKVTITAILKPKILNRDVEMVKDIVRNEISKNNNQYREFPIKKLSLEPMPLSAPPTVEYFNLSIFQVPKNNISITPSSDLSQSIKISFTATNINELMPVFFSITGLTGHIQVTPVGEKPLVLNIPFTLKIDDPRTIGSLELEPKNWRGKNWQNFSDFPVVLTYFNILRREQDNSYRIYSWKMGDTEIPPGAYASLDDTEVHPWYDASSMDTVSRVWMDYTLKPCVNCNNRARNKIIPPITRMATKPEKITITVINAMTFTEAAMIKISFRSIQATPERQQIQALSSVTITQDGQEIQGPTIFTVNNRADYEFRISVYLEDGTPYESMWIKSNNIEIVLGSKQIRDYINYFRNK